VYSYAHVPAGYTGDATAQIEAQIERFAPASRPLGRGQQAHNANYVGSDVVTGSNDALHLVLRPRPALDPYSTGVPDVFLCSAATPPGAGAFGMCGYNAANARCAT
jgi:phytoene dehydrogenase-like protein